MTAASSISAGGGQFCWVAAIEGYEYLLTDHSSTSAVATAWSGTGWTSVLSGLEVDCMFEQRCEPWEFRPDVPVCTLLVMDADGNDTFGQAVFRSKPTFQTRLTSTFEPTESGGTMNVQDTTFGSYLGSTGTVYVGGKAYDYSSKTSTSLTVSAAGAGKLAPFTTAGGSVMPWFHPVSPAAGVQVAANPKVTNAPRAAGWIDRQVALYLHKITGGVLDTRATAELKFAGRIKDIQDKGLQTVVVCEDLRGKLLDCVLHEKQFRGRLKEGIRLIAGSYFRAKEQDSGGVRTAADLTVVESGASGTDEINEGYYPLPEFYGRLNDWLNADATLTETWDVSIVDADGPRTQIRVDFGSADSENKLILSTDQPGYLEHMGFEGFKRTSALGYYVSSDEGTSIVTLHGSAAPFRVRAGQNTNTAGARDHRVLTLELEDDTEGTWADLNDHLPPPLKEWSNGANYGLLLIGDNITCFAKHDSDTLFTNVKFNDPFSLMGTTAEADTLRAGKRYGEDGDIDVRQVLLVAGAFSDVMTRLVASINGSGVNHPSYDVYPTGAGIPWSLLGPTWINSLRSLEQASGDDGLVVLIEKPTRLWEVIEPELALRFAWLVFKDGVYQVVSPPTPNATLADHTLNETNKGGVPGDVDSQYTHTDITDKWLRNVVKIEYQRDVTDKYRDTLTIRDTTSIGDQQGEKTVTIKARNSYPGYSATGVAVEGLASALAARMMPVFGKPMRVFKRSLLLTHILDVCPGDTASFSDDIARDPTTGARGISNRGVIVSAQRHKLEPEIFAEVECYYSEEDRTFRYAPAGAFTGSGSTNTVLTIDDHAFSSSTDSTVDAARFVASDAVRVVERDPADPASPDSFTDTVASQTGSTVTLTNGFGAGGRPARDANKKYILVYDSYTSTQTSQKAYAFQADRTDGLIQDTIEPNQYGGKDNTDFSGSSPCEYPELIATAMATEGRPLSPAIGDMVARMANNLGSFGTATHLPWYFGNSGLSLPADSITVRAVYPMPIGFANFPAGKTRLLYIKPEFTTGGDVSVTVTSSQLPPTGNAGAGADLFKVPYNQVVFDGDIEPGVMALPIVEASGAPGCTWITMQTSGTGTFYGFSRCHLGPLWPVNAPWPRSGAEWQLATGRNSSPTALYHLNTDASIRDLIGSVNLTPSADVETEQWAVRTASYGCFTGHLSSSDEIIAASNTSLDVTTGSVAVVWAGAIDLRASGANLGIMGKQSASAGYSLSLDSSGNIDWTVDGASGAQTQSVDISAYIGEPIIIMGEFDTANNSHQLHVWRNGAVTSSAGTTASGLGSLTNTDTFAFGAYGTTSTVTAHHTWGTVLTGSAAEGLTATHLDNLGFAVFGI